MKCVSIFLNTADELPINFKFSAAYLINSAIHNREQKTIRIFELDGRVDLKLSCESRIKIYTPFANLQCLLRNCPFRELLKL